jgi:Fe2+ or Zn2+ uptake regulation protein
VCELLRISRKELNAAGKRVTNQRALLLDLIQRGGGHLDADELYRRARKKQPRLSLSTVYRTLQLLKGVGLVEELHFDESHHHYEVKPSAEHHHLVCLDCGKIVEFQCPLTRKMKKDIAMEKDFEVTGVEVQMTGYCPVCRYGKE